MKRIILSLITLMALGATMMTLLPIHSAKPKQPFHIAINEWVGFAPLYLAKEKGFFGDLPVELHFVDFEGERRAGLYAGRFQMICETIDMFETNRDATGYPGKIVLSFDESHGGDGIVAISEVKSIHDIKERTVVAEPGAPAYFILQMLLHKNGMTLRDIRLQNVGSADAAAAFMAGRVDIAGTYEPYLTESMQKRKGAHLLASSKNFPGLIVDVGIAGDQVTINRPQDLMQVYNGWCKAIDYMNKNRTESINRMSEAFKMNPSEFNKTIGGLRYFGRERNQRLFGTKQSPGPLFKAFKTNGEVLHANGLTTAVDPPSFHVDASIVRNSKQ